MAATWRAGRPRSDKPRVATFLILLMWAGSWISSRYYYEMLRVVNSHSGEDEALSEVFSYTGKYWLVLARYRKICPQGRLAYRALAWLLISGASLVVAFPLIIIFWNAKK